MLKRACIIALAAAFIVSPLSVDVAHAQFPQIRIPTLPGQSQPQQQNQTAQDAPKSLNQMLQDREQRLAQEARGNRTSTIIGTIVTIGAAAACGAFRSDVSEERRLLCAAAGALAGYGSYLLSREISRRLHANDQRRLLVAASESLRTGEPAALDFPDSSATGSVTPAGNRTTREAAVPIFYDSARVTDLASISVIAQPVSWNRRLEVRASPETSARSTGQIAANSVFFISGQVPEQNWYMVSQRVREESTNSEAFMVVGYVNMAEVRPAAEDAALTVIPVPETLAEGQVQATMTCDELAFEVRTARGQTEQDTSARCRGPEGTLLSA